MKDDRPEFEERFKDEVDPYLVGDPLTFWLAAAAFVTIIIAIATS